MIKPSLPAIIEADAQKGNNHTRSGSECRGPPLAEIISKDELETPRTAAELLDWVNSALARFDTKELKAEAREGKHFAKELTDEALPIGLFAAKYFEASPDVTITQVIGSQQHDALVDDSREVPSTIKFIEVTVSDRDYTETLRMEILNRDGSVAAYGKVRAQGPKRKRAVLEAESIAMKHDDVRNQHIKAIIGAVANKAKIEYPEHTALVVRVDDAVPFREDADIAALDEVASAKLVPMVSGREFDLLAFVGSQGLCLSYELSSD